MTILVAGHLAPSRSWPTTSGPRRAPTTSTSSSRGPGRGPGGDYGGQQGRAKPEGCDQRAGLGDDEAPALLVAGVAAIRGAARSSRSRGCARSASLSLSLEEHGSVRGTGGTRWVLNSPGRVPSSRSLSPPVDDRPGVWTWTGTVRTGLSSPPSKWQNHIYVSPSGDNLHERKLRYGEW
jgi:hypothetical protein